MRTVSSAERGLPPQQAQERREGLACPPGQLLPPRQPCPRQSCQLPLCPVQGTHVYPGSGMDWAVLAGTAAELGQDSG